jgi:hypothetical protein
LPAISFAGALRPVPDTLNATSSPVARLDSTSLSPPTTAA